MNETIEKVKELLGSKRKIVITTHANPDGDAMGSSLGLANYLNQKGHFAAVIAPTNYASFMNWLPGNEEVLIYPKSEAASQKLMEAADIIFCLDFNSLDRIGEMKVFVEKSKAVKIVIDHHPLPGDFPDFLFSDVTTSSTCELVYNFIESLGDISFINKEIAECLYTGILTDTGGFQFPVTTPRVHRITADLIEKGIDNSGIYHRMFNSFSESRLRLFGFSITEKLKVYPELKAAMISLNKEELQRFNIRTGDTEGLVNYPLKITGVNFASLIIDRTERIKMSFRSTGSFDVNNFARKHFDGGGHKNAAGGQSTEPLEAVIAKFEKVLPDYKGVLNY